MPSTRAFAPKSYGVASATSADHTRCLAIAALWPVVGSEHGGEASQEGPGDGVARPHVAPAALELAGQPCHHLRIAHVAVEHLDPGPVAVVVDSAQYRLGGACGRPWPVRPG